MTDDPKQPQAKAPERRYTPEQIGSGFLPGFCSPYPEHPEDMFRGGYQAAASKWQPVMAETFVTMSTRPGSTQPEPFILVTGRGGVYPTLKNIASGAVPRRPEGDEIYTALYEGKDRLHYPTYSGPQMTDVSQRVTIADLPPDPQALTGNTPMAAMVRETLQKKFGITDAAGMDATVSSGPLTLCFSLVDPQQNKYEPLALQGVVVYVKHPEIFKQDMKKDEHIIAEWVPLSDYIREASKDPKDQNLAALMPGVSKDQLQNGTLGGMVTQATLDMTKDMETFNRHTGCQLEPNAQGAQLQWQESNPSDLGTKAQQYMQQQLQHGTKQKPQTGRH